MEKLAEWTGGGGDTAGLGDSVRREHERCAQILHLDVARKIRAEPRRGRRRHHVYSTTSKFVEGRGRYLHRRSGRNARHCDLESDRAICWRRGGSPAWHWTGKKVGHAE